MARKSSAVQTAETAAFQNDSRDPLMVLSVEKAFKVLQLFNGSRPSLGLSQIAEEAGLDISAAQRFTHTLMRLGYLRKIESTKRFALSVGVLEFAHHYLRSSNFVNRSMQYLMHLSKETGETVNLTVLDDTQVVFVARLMSRHLLNNDVIVGARLPAYCTAPGIAILSYLPRDEAKAILTRSELKPVTPKTTWKLADLLAKLDRSEKQAYAVANEEYFHGDLSFASAIVDVHGFPVGAINLAVSNTRFSLEEAENRFAPLVVAAAQSISRQGLIAD